MWIKTRKVVFHNRGGVSLRIDGDEQRASAIRILAKRMHNLRHVEQCRRAYVRAMRIAEEDEERPTFDVCVGDWLAILIDQIERTANRRSARPGTAKIPAGVKKNTGENDQPGHKCRKDQQNVRRSRGHDVPAG